MSDTTGISEQEYAERRSRLGEKLRAQGIDALFVAPSSDLEYLTGLERDLPSFGNVHYAHGWVTGALIAGWGMLEPAGALAVVLLLASLV